MNRYKILIILFLLASRPLPAQIPLPSEMKQFLQKNIFVKYIADPNQPTPDIRNLPTKEIADNTTGIFFGKSNNSGMDLCAELMT